MVCNVTLCAVTLLTLQRTKLRYSPPRRRGGRRQAERAGVRMEARQGQDQRRAWAWFTTAIPGQGHAKNHCPLPDCVMSNHVAPSRERRPVAAEDIHCFSRRDFGRTAPSQKNLVFTLVVQVHDR